jgi:L-ascorbate metabolism protein UlaG (beta-lactamase superfamily)
MKMYLKDSVKMEPLIWQWYAWPHTISPLNAACNLVERYMKIMESYVKFPKIHMQAVQNPNLMGGPFIDLEGGHVEEVKDLLQRTKEDCKDLIQLHSVFKDFEKTLHREAVGNTLETFYAKLPNELKGLVELVYDTSNHPSMRFVEEFVYRKHYKDTHQGISLSLIEKDYRPFIMSTPRVNMEEEVYFNVPFSHEAIDQLFRSRHEPMDAAKFMGSFNIPESKQSLFLSFFSENPSQQAEDRNYLGEDVRIRFLGHACILLQTKELSILTDPIISYPVEGEPRFTYRDLPDVIDYVLLTHNHQDHVLFETLLQLRYKIKTIVVPKSRKGALEDPSLKLILQRIGFKNIIELEEFDSIEIKGGKIVGFPFFGEHSDLNIQSKIAHCVVLNNKKFLLAADSNNIDPFLYDHIFDYFGKIDVLFLGMECDGAPLSWLYAPYMPTPLNKAHDDERKLSGSNFEKAWSIVEKSGCKEAYVYAMGMEPWLHHIMALQYTPESIQITESDKFVAACKNKGIASERLFMKKEWVV